MAAPIWECRQAIGRRVVGTAVVIVANLAAFQILFQLHKLVHKTFIQRREAIAYANAEQIIDLQRSLGLFFEPALQRWVLQDEWLIKGFN